MAPRKTISGITAVLVSGYTAIEEYINSLADLLADGTLGGIFSDGFESGHVTA